MSIQLHNPLSKAYPVTSPFGDRIDPISGGKVFHNGIDFGFTQDYQAGNRPNVISATKGVISSVFVDDFGANFVWVQSDGFAVGYAHMDTVAVVKGQKLDVGSVIGIGGKTGRVTGPHLHFEIKLTNSKGRNIDPAPYFIKDTNMDNNTVKAFVIEGKTVNDWIEQAKDPRNVVVDSATVGFDSRTVKEWVNDTISWYNQAKIFDNQLHQVAAFVQDSGLQGIDMKEPVEMTEFLSKMFKVQQNLYNLKKHELETFLSDSGYSTLSEALEDVKRLKAAISAAQNSTPTIELGSAGIWIIDNYKDKFMKFWLTKVPYSVRGVIPTLVAYIIPLLCTYGISLVGGLDWAVMSLTLSPMAGSTLKSVIIRMLELWAAQFRAKQL